MKLVRMAVRNFSKDNIAGYFELFTTRREISRKVYCKALVDDDSKQHEGGSPASAKKFGASRIVAETEPSRRGHSTCLRFNLTLARIVLSSSSPQTTISSHIVSPLRPPFRHYWHDLAYPHRTDNRDLCRI